MLVSAREYRAHNGSVYGLQLPMIHPWTSRSGVIDLVLELFNATADLLESPSNNNIDDEDRTPQAQGETPHVQLPQLAALLFAVLNEHLEYLASPVVSESTKTLGDRENLKARFDQLRPEVLDTLRKLSAVYLLLTNPKYQL
jgi:nuclear pore complex protein Nup133